MKDENFNQNNYKHDMWKHTKSKMQVRICKLHRAHFRSQTSKEWTWQVPDTIRRMRERSVEGILKWIARSVRVNPLLKFSELWLNLFLGNSPKCSLLPLNQVFLKLILFWYCWLAGLEKHHGWSSERKVDWDTEWSLHQHLHYDQKWASGVTVFPS